MWCGPRCGGHPSVLLGDAPSRVGAARLGREPLVDPVACAAPLHAPAQHLHFTALARWMRDFHVDGYRIDSVETVANWDVIGDFTKNGREDFRALCATQSMSQNEADARYIVIGEELREPLEIIRPQSCLNTLWHEQFCAYIRAALLGQPAANESFESTVRKAIDCRAVPLW